MSDVGTVKAGTILFKNSIMLSPEVKDLFPQTKGLEGDKLYNNEKFKELATDVITHITNSIMSLENPVKLKDQLHKLGKTLSTKGISSNSFEVLGNALIATIK